MQLSDFDDIRPYAEGEMKPAFESMLADRQFNKILQGLIPLPKGLRNGILRLMFKGIKTPLDFQIRFMKPLVYYVLHKATTGYSFFFPKTLDRNGNYTFMSNHRDIVLDSAFLDTFLLKDGFSTTVEIAIGNNLLIYPWIKTLVKMNKSFVVNRGLTPKEMLKSSIHMSQYMHFAINEKNENIWIAQREGRAKDSDDRTQESVLKMLTMGGLPTEGNSTDVSDVIKSLRELNIVPLTISYEYDPCDFLKAQEFQMKRDNPQFKKTRQDDLDNMKTGIFGYKGHVHYHCGRPVNEWIDELAGLPRTEFYAALSQRIDKEIHAGYRIFPNNYVALDELNGSNDHAVHYTQADKERFDQYLKQQMDKVDIPDKDEPFLREMLITMYVNPLRNYLKTR